MALDCTTPRGRECIEAQRAIVLRCERAWSLWAAQTPHEKGSAVDAFFARGGDLQFVAEVKARDMTLAQLRAFGSYLITRDKLRQGRALARACCVPFRLVVGLSDGPVVWWLVSEANGAWKVRGHSARTQTQATCNGGTALRDNAYLSLHGMQMLDELAPTDAGVTVDEIGW